MTAAVEIVIPKHSSKLQRAIGATGTARFVNEPSARVAEQFLVASLSDLNDAKHRKELDGFVDLLVEAAGDVSLVLIQAQPGEATTGAGLQALVHWTTLLSREPYIAPDPAVVRRMILARQSNAQRRSSHRRPSTTALSSFGRVSRDASRCLFSQYRHSLA